MTERRAHLRIGIDTGGTFTDIVAVDGGLGRDRASPRSPSTPANPAIGLVRGVKADSRCQTGARPTTSPDSRTARRSRPTRCCRARSTSLGLIVTEGFRHILEIARQSVPEGYGNSYFWVKPERIVPLRARARGRRPARFPRRGAAPARRAGACARRRGSFSAAGHPRRRRLPDPLVRQRRARAARAPRSSPRNIPTARCRSRATCCRNIANTSAR